MAAGNSTAFPVYGQAFRFYFVVVSVLTGLPITGGLTVLATQISKDGGAFANTGTVGTESPANSGFGYVDLSAAEMTAQSIYATVTATNTNAVCIPINIVTLQLGPTSGSALDQAVILFEQIVRDCAEVLYTNGTYNGQSQVLGNRTGGGNKAVRTVSGAPGNGGTGVAGNLQ